MKVKGNILIAFMLFCSLSLTARNTPPDGGPGGPGGSGAPGSMQNSAIANLTIEKLKTELKLTEEQATKLEPLITHIKELYEKLQKKMKSSSRSSSGRSKHSRGGPGSQGGMDMQKTQKLMEKFQKKVLKIIEPAKEFLSEEQYTALVNKLTEKSQQQGPPGEKPGKPGENSQSYTLSGSYTVDGQTVTRTHTQYTSNKTDTSAVYVKNSGNLTLSDVKISTTGNTTSNENSSFYGLNAAVLATTGSKVNINGGYIVTSGTGANAAFAVGSKTVVALSNMKLKATGGGGHGVMATQGGTVTLNNVDIYTADERAGAIATDRGSGTITVKGGKVHTKGYGSPVIYSTGDISATGLNGIASGAEAAVIEGGNKITLTDCNLIGKKLWCVMIYQSFSGDAEGNIGAFTMTNGSLDAESGPLFFVTNSKGIIKLRNVKTTTKSGIIVHAASSRWGYKGSNGGHAQLTADNQELNGDFLCDEKSSISASLNHKSVLKGKINKAALAIDKTSKWIITGNSSLSTLTLNETTLESAVSSTGTYTVTYDSRLQKNSWLGNKTYDLPGGGKLVPYKPRPIKLTRKTHRFQEIN